jgi:Vesicle coat complex COPII, subunit SEC24/subunit SFB2/subunit SFB3
MLQRLSTGHIVWRLEENCSGSLSPKLIALLSKWAQRSFWSREAGGLLLGFIDNETEGLLGELATTPGRGDRRSRTSFYRGSRHQQEAIEWNRITDGRGTQLGLWHTHPELDPTPSQTDLEDCRNVLATGKFAVDGILYLIVGTRSIGCWFAKSGSPLVLLGYFTP